MHQRDDAASWVGCGVAAVFILVYAMVLFGIQGVYAPSVIVFAAALIAFKSGISRWSAIDMALAAVLAINVASALCSPCRIPAYNHACVSVLLWCAYLLMRRVSACERTAAFIINGYGAAGICAAAMAIATFILCASAAERLGFEDLYSIRYLYRPLGFTNNSWGEMALLLTGLSFLLPRFKGVAACLTAGAALLTFSRGTYISLLLLIFAYLLFLRPLSRCRGAIAGVILAAISVGVIFPSEVLTTISMVKTRSQQDSLEWRERTTEEARKLSLDRPLFGYGKGTYTLATCGVKADGSDNTFTNSAPNILSQISVEQGIVGILSASVLGISVLAYLIRYRHLHHVVIIGGMFVALMVKEMSQATFVHSLPAQFLSITLLAYLQKNSGPENRHVAGNLWRNGRLTGIVMLVCAIVTVILPKEAIRDRDSASIAEAVAHLKSGNLQEAIKDLESTSCSVRNFDPYIDRLLAYSYIRTNQCGKAEALPASATGIDGITLWLKGECEYNRGNIERAVAIWADAVYLTPVILNAQEFCSLRLTDSITAKTILERIETEIHPKTAVEKARYGYIIHHSGNKEKAYDILSEAIADYPTLRTPHLLLGDTARYDFLRNGALSYSPRDISGRPKSNTKNEKSDLLKIIFDSYRLSLHEWYSINIDNL